MEDRLAEKRYICSRSPPEALKKELTELDTILLKDAPESLL